MMRPLLLAPLIFIYHFLEESPTFVAWFNSHVSRGITQGLFWQVNLTALFITVAVVALEYYAPSVISIVLIIVWFSCLMFANALFHLAAAVLDQGYVPGVVTAAVLYLPFYAWIFWKAVKSRRVHIGVLLVALLVGATPMIIHGYLILFRGSRLM